jgi:hypothetical protein
LSEESQKFESHVFFFYCGRAKPELKSASGLLYLSQPSVAITDAGRLGLLQLQASICRKESQQAL